MENILLTRGGSVKLCDFGSATNKHLVPDDTWTAVQRGLVEDEVREGGREEGRERGREQRREKGKV